MKGGESAADPSRELDDCSRESQQSLLGNSELGTCGSSKQWADVEKEKMRKWLRTKWNLGKDRKKVDGARQERGEQTKGVDFKKQKGG